TMLSAITAGGLVVLSLGVMLTRQRVMGDEVDLPTAPGTWKITMVVQGHSAGDAKVMTATPLDFNRQHVLHERYHSPQMVDKPPEARRPNRRQVLWSRKPGVSDGAFKLHSEFHIALDLARPTAPMTQLGHTLYAPPGPGDYLDLEARPPADHERIAALARQLTQQVSDPSDQVEALFRYVDKQIANEPSIGGPPETAGDCLRNGGGDCGAKAPLPPAPLRHRGVPARIVTGVTLTKGREQLAHLWVEAWVHGHWMSLCPFYHHFGRVPPTYLVFGFGDLPVVRGRQARNLDYAFLVERVTDDPEA